MKTLMLFRHGKSDWTAEYTSDHDRPLAPRGREAADRMGRFIAKVKAVPDVAATSTALRARETLDSAVRSGEWSCHLRERSDLYESSAETVLGVVRAEPDETESLMLVGHEPTWSGVLSLLVGGGAFRFPTAAVACVDLHIGGWTEVDVGCGRLRWLVTPKVVKG